MSLEKEAAVYRGVKVDSVYIGGGTPTHLSLGQIKHLFSIVNNCFQIAKGIEVTIEANPATFDEEKASAIRSFGANRISLGVQSLNDDYLAWLGRIHSRRDAVEAFKILRRAGFDNINVDYIYALPDQSQKELRADLKELLDLGSEHVSLYILSVAEGSDFFKNNIRSVDADRQAKMFRLITGLIKKRGYNHYEVSNFSFKGKECVHNLNYWRCGEYLGLGAGAHSHLKGKRYWNTSDVDLYIDVLNNGKSAVEAEERLSVEKRFMEALLIGLRVTDGVDLEAIEARFGLKIPGDKIKQLEALKQHGLLREEGNRLKTTLEGMLVLDEISSGLI